jgi:hypothetical protein
MVRGEGVEPSSAASKTAGLPLADPRAAQQAEGEGVEPSRLIAQPFSRRLPSPIGLPFRKAAAAGIEPAIVSLTGSRLTIRPHRNSGVRSQESELDRKGLAC